MVSISRCVVSLMIVMMGFGKMLDWIYDSMDGNVLWLLSMWISMLNVVNVIVISIMWFVGVCWIMSISVRLMLMIVSVVFSYR